MVISCLVLNWIWNFPLFSFLLQAHSNLCQCYTVERVVYGVNQTLFGFQLCESWEDGRSDIAEPIYSLTYELGVGTFCLKFSVFSVHFSQSISLLLGWKLMSLLGFHHANVRCWELWFCFWIHSSSNHNFSIICKLEKAIFEKLFCTIWCCIEADERRRDGKFSCLSREDILLSAQNRERDSIEPCEGKIASLWRRKITFTSSSDGFSCSHLTRNRF